MGKRYFWFKMKNGFFNDKRIKKLRRIAGGDTFTIIYLKMMLKSLDNNGVLVYEGVEDSFAAELALDLDEDEDNVEITISFLLQTGLLIACDNNEYFMPEVAENTGSECDSAERVRKHRAEQKALPSNKKALPSNGETLQSNKDVTKCNTEIEIEKEIEKETEKEKDTDIHKNNAKAIDYQQIIDMYNNTCVSFPKVIKLTDKRKKLIKDSLKNYSLAEFQIVFEKAEMSNFLKGNVTNFKGSFDWIISEEKMPRILEGNYDNRESNKTNQQKQKDNFQGIMDFIEEKSEGQ